MSDIKLAKANLLEMLNGPVDQALSKYNFKRRRGSLVYKRKLVESIQEIDFITEFFPRYEQGAEAHIHPFFVWKIPLVSKEALRLVNGNKMLLANAPDIVLKQPIEISAPKEYHERWFTKSAEDYSRVGVAICSFIEQWLVELLERLQGIDDLLEAYESSDNCLLKQQHWYVYVTAAYLLKGEREKARSVMESHLGNPGLKKRYSAVYDNI
ncbi:hypothetical protein OQJ46_14580 [Microbulbifer thermotolerans]|uniref:hypothetical protein n=1 Tax=Microbulbifer thermotolerans TaxID=252514 RepID=UPI001113C261|nr:hypothetical protein [Microbulbifer thermotolerans]MCX2784216.1 hypothetical protein [Microbulbifer thermotolerans]WKT59634.1 hypothetical protein Q2E61_12100 [Microbulbifer thermotolerans]